MDLAVEYARQYAWRPWEKAYERLPPLASAHVLDLGCAIGDQARDLALRGARVVAIDGNAQLLAHAASRAIPNVAFVRADIARPPVRPVFDGIWASFVAAYFPDFRPVLAGWRELLKPRGWIALTEVGGLFAHEPLEARCRDFLRSYADEAAAAGRYDFDMGARLGEHLSASGFEIEAELLLPDLELSFAGPARADVLQAWRDRFGRMRLLAEHASTQCPSLQEEFLRCLASRSHASAARVHFCLARRRD